MFCSISVEHCGCGNRIVTPWLRLVPRFLFRICNHSILCQLSLTTHVHASICSYLA
jgi:hypothetical protein